MQPTTFPHWATWQHISGVVRGDMSATARPWPAWQGWVAREAGAGAGGRRRVRLSLHDLADLRDLKLDWARLPRLPRPEITFYTPNEIRHLIRFDSAASHARAHALPTAGPAAAGAGWLPAQARDPATHWRLADISQYQLGGGGGAGAGARGGAAGEGGERAWAAGAARALALGAAALVLLALLARLADRCLDAGLFRRRRAAEWAAASVTATSNATNVTAQAEVPHHELNPTGPEGGPPAPDLPPPYSECAPAAAGSVSLPPKAEDPPPPYNSACYVSYSNPKAGVPSVHFYNNLFGTATDTNRASGSPSRDLHIYGFDLDTGQTPRSGGSAGRGGRGLAGDSGPVVATGGIRHFDSGQPARSDRRDDSNVTDGGKPTDTIGSVFIA